MQFLSFFFFLQINKQPLVNSQDDQKSPAPHQSVPEIRNVVIGVTPMALGGVVRDSQVVESGQEDEQPDDDDGDGAVWVLQDKKRVEMGQSGG